MATDRLELEQLEERQLLSTVQIFAAGYEGNEIFSLQVDEQTVATFEADGGGRTGDLRTFEFTTDQTLTADQIRIAFENDGFDANTGYDRNLRVDAIAIDGVRYETESVHTLSTGTWIPETGVTSGFHETEILHTNGFLQYSSNTDQGPLIRFRVRGNEGGEQFDLRIDGQTVQSYQAFDGFIIYSYQAQEPVSADRISLAFTNDFYDPANDFDRNLTVDWLDVNGDRIQTTNGNIFSTGTFTDADGIVDGFGRGDVLHGNGLFQFASTPLDGTGSTIVVRASGDIGVEELELQIDERTVATFTVTQSFEDYVFVADRDITADQIRVRFSNDIFNPNIDRNLNVDFVSIDGQVFESESESTFSTGTFNDADGIVAGFGRGSTLQVQGFFEYGQTPENRPLNINGNAVFERNGHLYFVSSGSLNWEEAQAEAATFGANLATVNSRDEELFLQETFGNNVRWIGLSDSTAGEGQFRWASGETVFYTNYIPGQPDNAGGAENYIVLNAGDDFRWEDNNISIRHFGIYEINEAFV